MGTVAKGVTSLFGGRKRRREQKAADVEFGGSKESLQDFDFQNKFADIEAAQVEAQGYDPTLAQVGTLGEAQGYDAQGYSSQGYTAEGYDAAQAQAAQAARVNLGENTGRTNQFNNLQVATGAAEFEAAQTDQALAQTLASGAVTGAGSATAAFQAAAQSKAGSAANIQQQEAQIAHARAQGATDVQREDLQQRNLSRQADIQQGQFNTGLEQNTRLANLQATNRASEFGASARNDASRFTAAEANAASRFSADASNQANRFGAQQNNAFTQSQFDASNRFALEGAAAQTAASRFGADASNVAAARNAAATNEFALESARGAAGVQDRQFGKEKLLFDVAANRKTSADQARNQATGDLVGGIIGGVGAAASGGLFGAGKFATGLGNVFNAFKG